MNESTNSRGAPAGLSPIERVRLHRLAACLTNGTSLNYPHHRTDVRLLLGELERVRADNAHLREEKARVWAQLNAPVRATHLREIVSWTAVMLSFLLWVAALVIAYAAGRAGR